VGEPIIPFCVCVASLTLESVPLTYSWGTVATVVGPALKRLRGRSVGGSRTVRWWSKRLSAGTSQKIFSEREVVASIRTTSEPMGDRVRVDGIPFEGAAVPYIGVFAFPDA